MPNVPNDFHRIGVELQNVITAIEHEHKTELIAALTRLRNIFFARGAEAQSAMDRLQEIVLGTPAPDRAELPINWHDMLDARGRPVDGTGRLIK